MLNPIPSLLSLCLLAGAAGARQVPNLIARYELGELAGTAALDTSGNGHDGTYVGAYTLGQPGASACTGAAVEMDHVLTARIDVPDGPGLTGLVANATVTAWVFPETYGATGRMRIFGNDGAWSCAVDQAGLLFTTRGIKDYLLIGNVPLNTWTHVGFVFDASFNVTFFQDGVNKGTILGTAPSNAPLPNWHVGTLNTLIENWDGRLDDIQVYDRALTDAEVLGLASGPGSTIGDAPLVYCTAKTGLVCGPPSIGFQGCPAPGVGAFDVWAQPARGGRRAVLVYSDGGRATVPFHGATLCVQPSGLAKTVAVSAGGTPGACNGAFSIDFAAFAQGQLGGAPAAYLQVPGTQINAQWWGRDSVATGSFLSDALEFTIR